LEKILFDNLESEYLKKLCFDGEKFFKTGDFVNSRQCLEEYVSSDGQSGEAFFFLGSIYHSEGQIGKAIKCFSKVLEINPNHTDSVLCLSVLYNDIGQYDKGKELFEKANNIVEKSCYSEDLKINKTFSQRHYELAEMYLSYQKYEEAIFELNKASALDQDNLEIRIKLARTFAKKGLNVKAEEELIRLKTEYPKFIEARVSLGLFYFSLGKVIDAQLEWEQGLNVDPQNKDLRNYLQMSNNSLETKL
jgi:tetratricopeptide (TPR) repeat protein